MELDLAAVKQEFARFSGEAADEEGTEREALCAALCAQCAQQVRGQVRPCLTEEELQAWEAGLEVLAAAQAFYQLLLTEEAVTPQSITAGEVKVTQGGGSERAALLVEEKRRAVAPALEEPGFYFSQVRWKP